MKAKLLLLIEKTFFLIFMITVISALVFAQEARSQTDTVYINPTYLGISTGSLAQPYKHWKDVPGNTNLASNMVYAQRRGTRDTITTTIGANQKVNVTIGVYGTGTEYAHLFSPTTGNYKIISLSSVYHGKIDGLHLSGTYQNNCAIEITCHWQATAFTNHNIKILNCLIEKNNYGIRYFKKSLSAADTLTIDNVKINKTYDDGIFIQTLNGTTLHNIDINNCYIDSVNQRYFPGATEVQAGGDGIQFSAESGTDAFDGVRIRNTTIDRRNSFLKACLIINGQSGTTAYNMSVENCTFYAPGYGGCLYLDHMATEIKNNRFYVSNLSYGIITRGYAAINCHHNIFTRPGSLGSSNTLDIGAQPNFFHNNTFYGHNLVFQMNSGSFTSEVKNNIFSSVATVYTVLTGLTKDYNLYYNTSNTGGPETNSIYNRDPLFIDPILGLFPLQSTSPCIDHGITTSYNSDITGTTLPQGAGYDTGAYEYMATSDIIVPTAPNGLVASTINYTSFTLSWNASTDNERVIGYEVYKNGTKFTSIQGTSIDFTGLTQGKSYAITVKAKDAAGNVSTVSEIIVSTLQASDTEIPTTPYKLVVSIIRPTSFTFTWNASTDNTGVDTYDVYKDGTLFTTLNAPATSLSIIGLSPNITYAMTVKAKDAVGNVSSESTALSVTTIASCGNPDGFINIPSATQTGTFLVELDAIPSGYNMDGAIGFSNNPSTGYSNMACIVRFNSSGNIDARNGGSYVAETVLAYEAWTSYHFKIVVSLTSHTYDIYVTPEGGSQVTIGTGYSFRTEQAGVSQLNYFVKVSSSCVVNVSNFSLVTVDTQAPSVPAGLTSGYITETGFTLGWDASTDNVEVTGYDVYKDGTLLTSVTGTLANISGLTPETTYNFTVTAKDEAANVSAPGPALVVSTPPDTQAPSVPSRLLSGNITQTGFTLSWTASADSVGVTEYDVYKDGTLYTTVTGTSAIITGLTIGTTYSMTVKAKDAASNISGASNALSVTILDTEAPSIPIELVSNKIKKNRFTLSWTASTDNIGVTGYDVYKDGILITTVTDTFTDISGLVPATAYSFTVKAKDSEGNISAESYALQVTTLNDKKTPATPTDLSVKEITQNSLVLTWTVSTDNVGVTGYDVYQNNTFLENVTSTSTSITNLKANTEYRFHVKAKDAAGNTSTASNSIKATTLSVCTGGPRRDTNTSFTNQGGAFTAEIDVIPGSDAMNGLFGLSDRKAFIYTNLACIVRFSTNGMFEVRNGNTYSADNIFPYTSNTAYHVRMVINIRTHKYNVYVKQIGETEVLIASQYSFNSKQSSITQLNNLYVETKTDCLAVSNFTLANGLKSASVDLEMSKTDIINPILIYPNPADDIVNIQLPERSTVKIIDISGKLLFNKLLEQGITGIPLNLEPGIYLIQVFVENNRVFSSKLIVK